MTENIVSSFNESINNSVKKAQKDLETLPSKVGQVADVVSDASTVVAAGGILASPFTGGSSLSITGYALTVGQYADATSTLAKGIDAYAFGGSSSDFENQFTKTVLTLGSGAILNYATAKVVTRTGLSNVLFRSAPTGRFVTNSFGYTIQAVRDATKISIGLGL